MSSEAEAECRFDKETGDNKEVERIGVEFLRVSNRNPTTSPISSKAKKGNVKERVILSTFKIRTR